MLDLIYDYTSNVALYPTWQAYLREHQPPTLITWGTNDQYFIMMAAVRTSRTCRRQSFICSTPATSRSRRMLPRSRS
jgi:hypothetical protein